MSAAKFREFAAEHLDWARTATSDRERKTFEQMARAWLEVAAVWEGAIGGDGGKLDPVLAQYPAGDRPVAEVSAHRAALEHDPENRLSEKIMLR